jgi:hypothetical protein
MSNITSKYTPNDYNLGGTVDLLLTPYDTNDIVFDPIEARLSIKSPDGDILTVSGDDMTYVTSGYLFYTYKPELIGWYEYEGWVKDNTGREIAKTKGFEITDRVY